MEVVQTMLKQKTEKGHHVMVAWLPVDPKVKQGSVLTLKDAPELGEWRVAEQFTRQDSSLIPRKWGLDLPKSQRTEW